MVIMFMASFTASLLVILACLGFPLFWKFPRHTWEWVPT